jgi:hypothetical protein
MSSISNLGILNGQDSQWSLTKINVQHETQANKQQNIKCLSYRQKNIQCLKRRQANEYQMFKTKTDRRFPMFKTKTDKRISNVYCEDRQWNI